MKRHATAHQLTKTDIEFRVEDDLPDGICGRIHGVALIYNQWDDRLSRFKPGSLDRSKGEKVAAGKVKFLGS